MESMLRGRMEDYELVTLTDIAKLLDVSKWAVRNWPARAGWPMSAGTVDRHGHQRTAWRWGDVLEYCRINRLPDRSRQEGVKRARDARPKDD